LNSFLLIIVVAVADLISIGVASPSASRTAAETAGASSTSVGGGQPQNQQGGAAARSSTSFLAVIGAFTAISMFI
jgi:hypothetical protein